ncbi:MULTISPECIES: YafY family protein [Paenibacillus]|uniref:helix-turn-helix transcriptional regulator n=1 Tax=Paenibacillus TaxID=44249 RepID=UPI002FE0535F
MNKTDRMLAILMELQRREVTRAEDLAATFETSVRTIYRDIQALSEAGVPLVGAPGRGYSLMEGYFLPPISFTAEEAVALLMGTDLVQRIFDAEYGAKAEMSRRKIEAILPERVRSEAARVRDTMKLPQLGAYARLHSEKAYVEMLRGAVLEERKIRFGYSKKIPGPDGKRQSVRTVAPYGLVFNQGAWTLVAYCELRREIRHFRVSRMSGLTVQPDSFQKPSDFNLQAYTPPDDRNLRIRIRVNPGAADRVRESRNYYWEAEEELPDGLHVTFRVRQPEELLPWLLGFGAGVVVLEPESLRKRVREEAENLLKRY